MIAGMTAAVLQGIPVATVDVDFWIGTPQSDLDAVLRICHGLDATILTGHLNVSQAASMTRVAASGLAWAMKCQMPQSSSSTQGSRIYLGIRAGFF
ncbi:MAG TPA: hypothetical protein VFC44_00800 [Candidatus Saccharimonadales bacterium]|nr:hypothetical protein [Candidatus Saccharimonadales bacterium]